ncbi:serine protease S53 [Heterobasidion irregulare TC 32-1]|uniref:Serine protease S53 n=1 Tax=Heterobasidion irregulare (strain TC 32-1) TaxID=747525 RepID=W4JXF9_HETIT|nr:serine protease S53 [Heterobasidion irregulare TC 32-1]ETW78233.1 serine protease S53 [Heterobasidion irregulare TC 32-1]
MRAHERIDRSPEGFVHSGPAPAQHTLTLHLGLAQGNFKVLEDALYAVSTPSNPRYGQHLTKEETEALIAPTPETVAAGSPAGDYIRVNATIAQAKFGATAIRTLEYSTPAALKDHVNFIHPTVSFPVRNVMRSIKKTTLKMKSDVYINSTVRPVPEVYNGTVAPSTLRAQYGIPDAPATQAIKTISVFEFGNSWASEADLKLFRADFQPASSSSGTFNVYSTDRNSDPTRHDHTVEANLGVRYTVGLALGIKSAFVCGEDDVDGFLAEASFLLEQPHAPGHNHITRYKQGTHFAYPCQVYAVLDAHGAYLHLEMAVFQVFVTNTGTNFNQSSLQLAPLRISVTAVGDTTGTNPEVAAPFSSGGFSRLFDRPFTQDSAVGAYLEELGKAYEGLFNLNGPKDIIITLKGEAITVDGTSGSSSIFASIIALLNDERTATTKLPLGFLNPMIYALPSIFNDITSGHWPWVAELHRLWNVDESVITIVAPELQTGWEVQNRAPRSIF